ncbi:hypothetical protein BMS3Bbin05_01150 [bacterium BMS3Bbin05]|nr:hypothetical protein BMS3Bbin05_01150 [bacterium BMS3Bbin05]
MEKTGRLNHSIQPSLLQGRLDPANPGIFNHFSRLRFLRLRYSDSYDFKVIVTNKQTTVKKVLMFLCPEVPKLKYIFVEFRKRVKEKIKDRRKRL